MPLLPSPGRPPNRVRCRQKTRPGGLRSVVPTSAATSAFPGDQGRCHAFKGSGCRQVGRLHRPPPLAAGLPENPFEAGPRAPRLNRRLPPRRLPRRNHRNPERREHASIADRMGLAGWTPVVISAVAFSMWPPPLSETPQEFEVKPRTDGKRIDAYLASRFTDYSRA